LASQLSEAFTFQNGNAVEKPRCRRSWVIA